MPAKIRSLSLPIVGGYDYRRLKLLESALRESTARDRHPAEALRAKLERAEVVHPREIPPDVVTLYSRVRFRNLSTGEEHTWVLVFPGETRDREDCVSVLAPVGIALLGERTGTTVGCTTPEGKSMLRILAVEYQPEAVGAYNV